MSWSDILYENFRVASYYTPVYYDQNSTVMKRFNKHYKLVRINRYLRVKVLNIKFYFHTGCSFVQLFQPDILEKNRFLRKTKNGKGHKKIAFSTRK